MKPYFLRLAKIMKPRYVDDIFVTKLVTKMSKLSLTSLWYLLARTNRNPKRIVVRWCYGRRRSCFSNGEKWINRSRQILPIFWQIIISSFVSLVWKTSRHNEIFIRSCRKIWIEIATLIGFLCKMTPNDLNITPYDSYDMIQDDLWKPETVTHGRQKSSYMKKKQNRWKNWKRKKEPKNDWKKLPCIEKTSMKWGRYSNWYF